LDVHQNEVGLLLLCQLDAFLAIRGLDQLIAGHAQQVAQYGPVVLLILHHENSVAHAAPMRCAALTGSSNWNVAPLPGSDFTEICPPCSSTMRLAMASPSPVPPFFFVLELST